MTAGPALAPPPAPPATHEATPCPACGARRREPALVAEELFGGGPFAVLRCTGCGLLATAGDPTPEELVRWYEYGSCDAGRRFGFLAPLLGRLRAGRLAAVERLAPAGGPRRILDVGCGDGAFLAALRDRGWEVTGTEVAPEVGATARARLGERVRIGALERLDLLRAAFDVVTFWHVLEHLPRPDAALAVTRDLLRPGGRIVVEVPNRGSWQARWTGRRWLHLDVPRHRHHFERATLLRLAAGAGLTPVETATPFSLDLGAFGLFQSLAAGAGLGAFLFTDVVRPHRPGWWRRPRGLVHLALAPLLAGLAVIAVAVEAAAAAAGRGGVLRVVLRKATEEAV